jgi:hypothetical protein
VKRVLSEVIKTIYTSVQVQDFNWAEEQAVITKLSYNFSRLGLAARGESRAYSNRSRW